MLCYKNAHFIIIVIVVVVIVVVVVAVAVVKYVARRLALLQLSIVVGRYLLSLTLA